MLQGSEDEVLSSASSFVLLRPSRSGSVRDCLCSGRVPDTDGELLQAGRDLLRRQELLLLGSDELLW